MNNTNDNNTYNNDNIQRNREIAKHGQPTTNDTEGQPAHAAVTASSPQGGAPHTPHPVLRAVAVVSTSSTTITTTTTTTTTTTYYYYYCCCCYCYQYFCLIDINNNDVDKQTNKQTKTRKNNNYNHNEHNIQRSRERAKYGQPTTNDVEGQPAHTAVTASSTQGREGGAPHTPHPVLGAEVCLFVVCWLLNVPATG